MRTRSPVQNVVIGINTGTGERTWGLMNAVPSFDADGALVDVACSITDITEVRRLHTIITSVAEMVADGVPPDSPAAADLTELLHAADRGAALTAQLAPGGWSKVRPWAAGSACPRGLRSPSPVQTRAGR